MNRRPAALSEQVSAQMRRMPRSATKPELALRRVLHARGLRFRINRRDLPGTPDIVLTRARIAVFVDGCYWHSCPEHGCTPRNNREWWSVKLRRNVQRDREKDAVLQALGWLPLHFWEHEPVDAVAATVEARWRERTGRDGGRG